jgi:hypothetical protein
MTRGHGDWDILLLDCYNMVSDEYTHHFEMLKFYGTLGYAISKRSAKRLVSILTGLPMIQQLDSELSDLASARELKILCARERLATIDRRFATLAQTVPVEYVLDVDDPSFESAKGYKF